MAVYLCTEDVMFVNIQYCLIEYLYALIDIMVKGDYAVIG